MKEYKFRSKCGDDFIDVYPETVGQFTGVKERYPQMVGEGQEIHFGDVVRLFGGEYCQGYYEYDQTIVVKSAYDIVAMEESENVKLLGNVWDNPELLKLVRRPFERRYFLERA